MFVLCHHVASPHSQSITKGGLRAEFMVNDRDMHAVSVVDLIVAEWKGSPQRMCWYLQCDVGIMSVETSYESIDGC